MDEIKLKPCPFCGGKAEINVDREAVEDTEKRHWAYTVVCKRCCATSGLTYLPEKAREAWNRRAEQVITLAPESMNMKWRKKDDNV